MKPSSARWVTRSAPSTCSGGVPITYVPARNTIFLSFALAWAEVLGAGDIFIGVNALDYSGYPDCRPEFVQAYERLANLAIAGAVEGRQRIRIRTPLLHLTKREIIVEVWQQVYGGGERTVDVHLSWLRRKLGESAAHPRYLHSVRGVGVRLAAPEDVP